MAEDRVDPLLLGQRVVAILETGLRTATYKLATLMALIDQCIENVPEDPAERLTVPIPDLARRVLEIYWRQVRPFDGHELRQSTQSRARILLAANALRAAADRDARGVSVDIAAPRAPAAYAATIDEITLCLARQPLHRLQRLPGSETSDWFSLRRLATARPGEQIDIAIARRRDRAQTRSRAGPGTLGGLAQAGPGDHVG